MTSLPSDYYDTSNYTVPCRSRQNILTLKPEDIESINNTSTISRNWEYSTITLTRVPGYGFGIAVSGGSDNPHFANGDPAIAISDVLKGGPAQGKLQINDRILSANGVPLDNVDYSTAVQILRDSGPLVTLHVKRRVNPQSHKLSIPVQQKRVKKLNYEYLGFNVSVTLQIKSVENHSTGLREGDIIEKIQGLRVSELFNEKLIVKEFKRVLEDPSSNSTLNLTVKRSNNNQQQQVIPEQSGNLYVQPPTRTGNKSIDGSSAPLPPPRPPLPTDYDTAPSPQRTINFIKQNQLGVRLSGGNKSGIIVSAVQKNSQAELQGLSTLDKIIRVNEHDFMSNPPTREEAIEILSSIPNDTLVNLTVEKSTLSVNQDEFYVLTRFSTDCFNTHELLLVTDTLVNGLVGQWEAYRVDSQGSIVSSKLIIPNVNNAKELVKKSWKRTTSFRNREYEDLLNTGIVTSPYDVFEKRTLATSTVCFYTPINTVIIESLVKHHKHKFRVVKATHTFIHGKVHLIEDLMSIKAIQETYESDNPPLVVYCNFPNKDAIKSAIKDPNRYNKVKKIFNVLQKLHSKLGAYIHVDMTIDNIDVLVNKLADIINQPHRVAFVKKSSTAMEWTNTEQPERSWSTQPIKPDAILTPRSKSTDSLAPRLPNYNIPPPHSVAQSEYEKRVTLHRSHTTTMQDTRYIAAVDTSVLKPHTSNNNFAHSPVLERSETVRNKFKPYAPPNVDRTNKPSSRGTTPNINVVKPIPPPKPKLIKYEKQVVQQEPDDTGQTYLNIPMNSKSANGNVTSGYFDWRGGRLVQKHVSRGQIPIELIIPEYAIPTEHTINVWFQIIDYNFRNDDETLEKMLSPLVKFGPENYRFKIPVEIRIPQYTGYSSSDTAKVLMNNSHDYWTKIDIQNGNYDDSTTSRVKIVSLTVQQF